MASKFVPVRGLWNDIQKIPLTDGQAYFAYDIRKLYLDTYVNNVLTRVPIGGGSGITVYWGIAPELTEESDGTYVFSKDYLEDADVVPAVNDFIFNQDGKVYHIAQIDEENGLFICDLWSMGGSGGGGEAISRPTLRIDSSQSTSGTVVVGSDIVIYFTATSMNDADGMPIDTTLSIEWELTDTLTNTVYQRSSGIGAFTVSSGVLSSIIFTPYLRQGTTKISMRAIGSNHSQSSYTRELTITLTELGIVVTGQDYDNRPIYNATSALTFTCDLTGDLLKIVTYEISYINNLGQEDIFTKDYIIDNISTQTVTLAISQDMQQAGLSLNHGSHKVTIRAFQNLGTSQNPVKGASSTPIYLNVVTYEPGSNQPPIIILKEDYSSKTYYEYDSIRVQYAVYNPANASTSATVVFLKNGLELMTSTLTNSISEWFTWEITDAELDQNNFYQIQCTQGGQTALAEFNIVVVKDPDRDLSLQQQPNMRVNFSAAGRSNNEPPARRASWSQEITGASAPITASFKNFNWVNNGWITDEDGATCLRISNGAEFTINRGSLSFGTNEAGSRDWTIQMQFKIRNAQVYSDLITMITRYRYTPNGSQDPIDDEALHTAFESSDYDNYDLYLRDHLTPEEYDSLEAYKTEEKFNSSYTVGSHYSASAGATTLSGWAIGPQDCCFANGTQTVSVSYVEDEMINLSLIYSCSQRMLILYLNGTITGAKIIESDDELPFDITNPSITFKSEYCDIDLYNYRDYITELDLREILINYAYDRHDIDIYDDTVGLAKPINQTIEQLILDYNSILNYNNTHTSAPTIPYILFDMTETDSEFNRLPWSKSEDDMLCKFTFVNAPLDAMYANGQLEELAMTEGLIKSDTTGMTQAQIDAMKEEGIKVYYKHHCPSFTTILEPGVYSEISVQGTSSQFYPRLNYKVKTKAETWDGEEFTQIYMNRGPFETAYNTLLGRVNTEGCKEGGVTGKDMMDNECCCENGWFLNNYTNPTDRWTLKVDYMESSGSFNAGFANIAGNIYTKHPLKDYINSGAIDSGDAKALAPDIEVPSKKFQNMHESDPDYNALYRPFKPDLPNTNDPQGIRWKDFRTSMQGFYVMAFQKLLPSEKASVSDSDYKFIGYYRMLIDKGSDELMGFKFTAEKADDDIKTEAFKGQQIEDKDDEIIDEITQKQYFIHKDYNPVWYDEDTQKWYDSNDEDVTNQILYETSEGSGEYIYKDTSAPYDGNASKVEPLEREIYYFDNKKFKFKDIVECWEYSTNSRTFCSFRDPNGRVELSFRVNTEDSSTSKLIPDSYQFAPGTNAPWVTQHFEHRYNWGEDLLDIALDYDKTEQSEINEVILELDNAKNEEERTTNWQRILDKGLIKNPEEQEELAWYYDRKFLQDALKNGIEIHEGDYPAHNPTKFQELILKFYRNWERACKWVWSTNMDNVISGANTYEEIAVGKALYEPSKYYYKPNPDAEVYELATTPEMQEELTYYEKVDDSNNYQVVVLVTDPDLVYESHKFYIYDEDTESYILSEDTEFNSINKYYTIVLLTDEQLKERANPIMDEATSYVTGKTYYKKNRLAKVQIAGSAGQESSKNNDLYIAVPEINSQEAFESYINTDSNFNSNLALGYEFEKNKLYTESDGVIYDGATYKYDVKEYRDAKFRNELTKHFDLEYCITYFIMTEVFECYDSRGKNCMMATWGPQEEGGDFIWYPIFYDIDTQLGINNTGLPSFEFNIDATEDFTFSTPDSILWNNIYRCYKDSYIKRKYQQLRSQTANTPFLTNNDYLITMGTQQVSPLSTARTLERWYEFDYGVTGNIADSGAKPLIVTNLDLQYKYTMIANNQMYPSNGAPNDSSQTSMWYITHLTPVDFDGSYETAPDTSMLYALQGDRSLSRYQFLTNRLEYIDSWLNVGNYARGGANNIRGRISANDMSGSTISDIWVEKPDVGASSYWIGDEFTSKKRHDFDAEYWLTLTPIRSAYVTAGGDGNVYPSQKYDGITPVTYPIDELETGIRTSENYAEQLLYIYGLNQLADLGNLYQMYWREFVINGDASHLIHFRLGWDGESTTEPGTYWYSRQLNTIALPNSMPLLEEFNISNITISATGSKTLNLTSSEKLKNFRAVGSNITNVTFAEGVALDTVYLPNTLTSLTLIQANNLTTLLKTRNYPASADKSMEIASGLYIDGMFDSSNTSNLTSIQIDGSSLHYGSYFVLEKLYQKYKNQGGAISRINLTDVNWCPYIVCGDGDIYDETKTYYRNNKHNGFELASDINVDTFENPTTELLNGNIYYYDDNYTEDAAQVADAAFTLLKDLSTNASFADNASTNNRPVISGIMYINNTTAITEKEIYELQQQYYPELQIFAKNVTQAYSAEFLYQPDETQEIFEYVPFRDGSTKDSVQKISVDEYTEGKTWFDNPGFEDVEGLYQPSRNHYDFQGWSTVPHPGEEDLIISDLETWQEQAIVPDEFSYTFYAIFKITSYDITFYNGDKTSVMQVIRVPYMNADGVPEPDDLPTKSDSGLPLNMTNAFVGWSTSASSNNVIDLSTYLVTNNQYMYPVFTETSVYDERNIHREWFVASGFNDVNMTCHIGPARKLSGKITIPNTMEVDGKIYNVRQIASAAFSVASDVPEAKPEWSLGITHVFFEKPCSVEVIGSNAFRANLSGQTTNSNLEFIEFPDSLTIIDAGAFSRVRTLSMKGREQEIAGLNGDKPQISGKNVSIIGQEAFLAAFPVIGDTTIEEFHIGGNVTSINTNAFLNIGYKPIDVFIGSPNELSKLNYLGSPIFRSVDVNVRYNLTVYAGPSYDQTYDESALQTRFEGSENIQIL